MSHELIVQVYEEFSQVMGIAHPLKKSAQTAMVYDGDLSHTVYLAQNTMELVLLHDIGIPFVVACNA